jgi:hypothetical protein
VLQSCFKVAKTLLQSAKGEIDVDSTWIVHYAAKGDAPSYAK